LGAWKLVRDVGLIPISLTGMFWFLRRRVDILVEADEFMESFGEHAYQEARYELAKAFERGDNARMKFLERVWTFLEIAAALERCWSSRFSLSRRLASTILRKFRLR
jgi:hypothetical protein